MTELVCLNGVLMPSDEARVSVWDRGFIFGDSIWRLYGGRLWLEAEHRSRLDRSLREMRIAGVDLDRLMRRAKETIAASGLHDATVYVQVTRGVAPRAHAFPDPPCEPTELIAVRAYDDAATAKKREQGGSVITYPDLRWERCDVKSTNLLANVLANQAAREAGADEAVLVLPSGQVTEASHSSLLWVRSGRLEATPEGHEILPGTTRAFFLKLAAQADVEFRESTIQVEDLRSAEEVILTGTTYEILPVVAIDHQEVASGRPGPVARRLQAAFRETVRAWLAPERETIAAG
jgi:D-alanine transaminase